MIIIKRLSSLIESYQTQPKKGIKSKKRHRTMLRY